MAVFHQGYGGVMGTEDAGRKLVLFRHAKSDWPDVGDHDRPLAKRGRRDAPVVGRWLGASGYVPDAVVCSTALRARQTWELAAEGLTFAAPGASPAVRYEKRVYEASALGLLMLVREFESGWRTAMIVGHNPGLAELTMGLASQDCAPPQAFPTAAVAVLGLGGPWAEIAPGEAGLLAFIVPAELRRLAGDAEPGKRTLFPVQHGEFELGTDGPSAILVGVDDSVTASRATAYAAGLARRQGARVFMVYVAPISGMALASATGPSVMVAENEAHDEVAKELAGRADLMTSELGISATFMMTHGDPYREITRIAMETRADAIVVGASLKAGHRLMGSLAVRLVRAGKWPVTVVP